MPLKSVQMADSLREKLALLSLRSSPCLSQAFGSMYKALAGLLLCLKNNSPHLNLVSRHRLTMPHFHFSMMGSMPK